MISQRSARGGGLARGHTKKMMTMQSTRKIRDSKDLKEVRIGEGWSEALPTYLTYFPLASLATPLLIASLLARFAHRSLEKTTPSPCP